MSRISTTAAAAVARRLAALAVVASLGALDGAGDRVAAQEPPADPGHGAAPAATDLTGAWLGTAEHNGQRAAMAIDFAEGADGRLTAALSFPDLRAWDVTRIPVRLDGDRVVLGPWELTWDRTETEPVLAGRLPGFFVPVHDIPVVFRRVARLSRDRPEPLPTTAPEAVWTRDLGAPIWAGLGLSGGRLFVGDDAGRVTALDAAGGQPLWEVATGGAVRSRPRVVGDTLFVHSDDGHLWALAPSSGEVLWRTHIADVDRAPLGASDSRYNHFASGVAPAGESVVVGGFDGSVVAIDGASGRERWRFRAGDTVAGTPAVADGRVVFGSFDGRVYALDEISGDELWSFDTGQPVVSSPLVRDGRVVIGSRSYDLFALDLATGEPVWKYYFWFSWVESSAVERDGVAYVGSSDAQWLVALDLATGRARWTFDTGGSAWPEPAVTEAAVFIGTIGVADYWANHHAGFLAVDRETGELLWRQPMDRPGSAASWGFAAAPAVDDARVFAADTGGRVYAFPRPSVAPVTRASGSPSR